MKSILIGTKLADEQFLYGKGAGRFPTSSAVLSDISALRYDYRYEYRKAKSAINYSLSTSFILKVYVSFESEAYIDKSYFEEIFYLASSIYRQNINIRSKRD